jgi:PAS domain S-box-containing protein
MCASNHEREPEPSETVPAGEIYGQGLNASKELLKRSFERAPIGMMIMDAEERLWESNLALKRMLGYDEKEACSDFTLSEDAQKDAELYGELMRGERQSFQLEKRYRADEQEVIRSGQPLVGKEELGQDGEGNSRRRRWWCRTPRFSFRTTASRSWGS